MVCHVSATFPQMRNLKDSSETPFIPRGLRDRKKTLCITHSAALQERVEGFYEEPMEGDQVPRKHRLQKCDTWVRITVPSFATLASKTPASVSPCLLWIIIILSLMNKSRFEMLEFCQVYKTAKKGNNRTRYWLELISEPVPTLFFHSE